ncbi:hypothetical protein, partial [Turicimonas muris]
KTTSDREFPDSATLEYFFNAIFNFSKISHSLDFLSREEISLLRKYPFNYSLYFLSPIRKNISHV